MDFNALDGLFEAKLKARGGVLGLLESYFLVYNFSRVWVTLITSDQRNLHDMISLWDKIADFYLDAAHSLLQFTRGLVAAEARSMAVMRPSILYLSIRL